MKFFSKAAKDSLSLLLAFVMLMSVFSVGAPLVFAAESKKAPVGDATPDELAPDNILGFELKPITVYKYSEDEDYQYDDDEKWYYYSYTEKLKGSLNTKDGKSYPISYGCIEFDEEDDRYFDLEVKDDQSPTNEWGAGKHEAEVSFNGYKQKIEVEVVELEIEKVEIEDTEATVGVDSKTEFTYDDDEIIDSYSYINYSVNYKITFKNGDVVRDEFSREFYDSFRYKNTDFRIYVNDGQFSNPWGPGVHEVSLEIFGKEYKFNVNVKESKIKKIEVEDIDLYEDIDKEDDVFYEYTPKFTVTLNDGTVKKSSNGYTNIDNKFVELEYDDDQSYDNPWGVGAHKVTGYILGMKVEFTVNIKKLPIKSLKVEDCVVFKNSDYSELNPDFTITLENGEEYKFVNNYSEKMNRYLFPQFSEDVEDLSEGQHTVKASLAGKKTEFTVTVYDSLVKKMEAEDITVTQGIDVSFRSNLEIETKVKLTLSDDTVITTSKTGSFEIDDYYDEVKFELDLGGADYLKPGTYKAIAKYGDVSTEYNVTVLPSKFKKVVFDNVIMYKDIDNKPLESSFDEDAPAGVKKKYHYDPSFKVIAEDGSVYRSEDYLYGEESLYGKYVKYEGRDYMPAFFDDQYTNAWDVGVHKVRGYILGVEAEFTVEIKPNPIKSITCDDIYIIAPDNEYDSGSGYIEDALLNLNLNDGKTEKVKVRDSMFKYNGAWYNVDFDHVDVYELENGDVVEVNGEAMGIEFKAKVHYVSTPVKSVSVNPLTVINGWDSYFEDGDNYYRINRSNLRYTVTLKDGTVLQSDENGEVEYKNTYYRFDEIYSASTWEWKTGNTYKGYGDILGFTTEFDINVIECPVKSAQIEDVNIQESDYYKYYDYDAQEYYKCYRYSPDKFTLTLKDGTVLKGENGSVEYNGINYQINYWEHCEQNQSFENQWSVGNSYNVTVNVLGYEASAKVNIVKDAEREKEAFDPDTPVIAPTLPVNNNNSAPKASVAKPAKKKNPVKVSTMKNALKAKKLKKKAQKVKAIKISKNKGAVTVTKVKSGTTKAIYKKIKVNKKTGVITFKKGKYAKKTYKIKLKIAVKGNSGYKPATITKTVKVKIK